MCKLYVDNECDFCKIAEEYLKINNVEFVKINIESGRCPKTIKSLGFVPVLDINGEIIHGFNKREIDYLLHIQSKNKIVYLDNAATTPVDRECVDQINRIYRKEFGNPASNHQIGFNALSIIEKSRHGISELLCCDPSEIIFTSGGSEANNTAIKGLAMANKKKGKHIITTVIEHKSVISPCKYLERNGFRVTYLPVNKDGLVDMKLLCRAICDDTILVSIMYANNEIGTIQNIEAIAEIIKSKEIAFHVDAVQAIGHIPINLSQLNVDTLSISAHKFYAPKGIGVLFCRKNSKLEPLIHGGEQENGFRAGTENVALISAMEIALRKRINNMESDEEKFRNLREYFISNLKNKISDVSINGCERSMISSIINITFSNHKEKPLEALLDLNGIEISQGSACAGGAISHVLKGIGLKRDAISNTIRFSLGIYNTKEEIDYTISVLAKIFLK